MRRCLHSLAIPTTSTAPGRKHSSIFEPFLKLCFPHVHAGIDWSRGYESLDKELQQIVADARVGKRLADKLFKVWRNDGREAWLLVHVEVQGQREKRFPRRMFEYNYRIYDMHGRPVVSLAVLCDEHPTWRPDHFGYNNWGCEVGIRFPVVKLIDFRRDEAALEQSANPFAAVILRSSKFWTPGTRRRPAGNGNSDWSRACTIADCKKNRFASSSAFLTGCWPYPLSSSSRSEPRSSDLRSRDVCPM